MKEGCCSLSFISRHFCFVFLFRDFEYPFFFFLGSVYTVLDT